MGSNARKQDTDFLSSAQKNNQSFLKYFYQLSQIAISRFKYSNLPPSIDPVFMERNLFFRGQICWFEDDILGILALPFAGGGDLSVYNLPYARNIYSNGYNAERTIDDSVVMYDNVYRTTIAQTIINFAEELAECDRSALVNIKSQKTPTVILCEESQRLTMINAYQKIDGNQPVIFADKKFNLDNIRSVNTQAPFVADKIQTIKSQIWNEALSFLGIPNVAAQKKERMITDEVTRGMGGTMANRFGYLDCRKTAVSQINAMFGTNITVEFATFDEQDEFEGEEDKALE